MDLEFISYKQALDLKELGFDEPCFGYYGELQEDSEIVLETRNVSQTGDLAKKICFTPLYQQAFRWFRDKHNLHGCVDLHVSNPTHWYIRIDNIVKNDYIYHSEDENLKFNTYEEAEQECLDKLIEIVKNK